MHELPLITTIAVAFTAAWLLGLLTQKLGLSPIVGYLMAGVLLGPSTPGFVADLQIAHQLAEVGVILLMFGVGLHFHLHDLLAVKGVAIPGAIGQSLVATLLGMAIFTRFGMPLSSSTVMGMAMSVASTVVLMRVLLDSDALNTTRGHIAVGWLLVEDVFTVIVLVLIPVLGGQDAAAAGITSAADLWVPLVVAMLKLAVLIAIVMLVGRRVIPWILVQVARLRSRELFTLTVLVFSIAIAAASYTFFGASMALGAFLAGMMVAQSPVSQQAAADALPMRDAFAVIFFVSVGMLIDPAFIVDQPLMIIAALAIIMLAKPLAALVIVAFLGHSSQTALTVALGLAQIGEFSFILADLAQKHNLMPDYGQSVLVAAAIISITLNPLLFRSLHPIQNWLRRHPTLWSLLNGRAERHIADVNLATAEQVGQRIAEGKRLAIVVGYGPVGRSVHRLLSDAGLSTVVIDLNIDTISDLSRQGQLAVFGDASHESILEQAGMQRASHLVVTLPQSSARLAVVTAARSMNADARILVRAHYLRERDDLEKGGATAAVFEEAEVAVALARLVLANTGARREVAEQVIRDLRLQLILENMSNIRLQRVRSVMVPWTRVRRLSTLAKRPDVLRHIAEHRYSRWPVTDGATGRVLGYLLAKDLIAEASADSEWTDLTRPLRAVRPDDDVASTLLQMQSEGATVCLVEEAGVPLGMITFEDILEQVVGRIEDEYPHEPGVSLHDAVQVGGVILQLSGQTRDEAVRELAARIPAGLVPPETQIDQLAIEREHELSTDLGVGVAVPHAQCPNLHSPLVVLGRSPDGIVFSPDSAHAVQFVFLLVTPLDHPDQQLALLAQIARISADESVRERLLKASSEAEVLDILSSPP
jgi:CPA2 family monovalent cation:H+ antiporter-2